ncbi:CaiB/BaiF CoA transferase family protein [Altererythrobacter sp. Z27]|uniref:CaiB/BaiF CoA transferase family protein n=1 Tax=Altererythrobacter sp. Z27 TaxID=3461147 RepID=UPI004044A2CF
MRTGPLAGIRVMEMGHLIAAPIAGQILADLGADVIKIERPGRGDEYRNYGPAYIRDIDGERTDMSAGFLVANTNKRSIALDIGLPEGRKLARNLAAKADIFIENFRAGTLDAQGLGREDLKAINPGLIYISISGFGRFGPAARRPGTDSAFQALTGLMSVTGDPDGLPQKVGTPVVDYVTALYATIGALAALIQRGHDKKGQAIDLSLLDCALALMSARAAEYFTTGDVPMRFGHRTTGAAPAQMFRCRDGFINVQAGFDHHFRSLCERLGLPELADDPRYLTRDQRVAHVDELEDQLQPAFLQRTVAEWYATLQEAQLICSPILDVRQCYADPDVMATGARRTIQHPLAGPVDFVANPLRFEKTPIERYDCAPGLGEHTEEILADWLGMKGETIADLRMETVFG